MNLKKGDFIEVEYTGSLGDQVFDTTSEEIAKKNNLHNPQNKYENLIICLGQGQLLKGLDDFLEGKEINKEYETKLQPENAFGRRNAKLIQMVPKSKFTSQNVAPQVGMQLNIDNTIARVVQVSGGRILVDFNHPLAGREVSYKIKVNKKIEDKSEQLKAIVYMELGLDKNLFEVKIDGDKGVIKLSENLKPLIDNIKDRLIDKVKETVDIKDFNIEYNPEDKKINKEEKKEVKLEENEKETKLEEDKKTIPNKDKKQE